MKRLCGFGVESKAVDADVMTLTSEIDATCPIASSDKDGVRRGSTFEEP